MDVRSIRHRGLRSFVEKDDSSGLSADQVPRIRDIMAALALAADASRIIGPPGWRVHRLKGPRAGTWSISVTGNWRITFRVENGEICDLDLEDYH